MRLANKGLKKLFLRKYEQKTGAAGGAAYSASEAAIEFFGKIQPANFKNEYSLAGFTYSADFVLFTNNSLDISVMDCICETPESMDYIVAGMKSYASHAEYALERKTGKGALV